MGGLMGISRWVASAEPGDWTWGTARGWFCLATLIQQLRKSCWLWLVLLALVSMARAGQPEEKNFDWPHWRGPEQNGISREAGLIERWAPSGQNLLWKNHELATRSTPIVMRGKLYTLIRSRPETKEECEAVICADAATGKVLWEHRFNVFLSDVPKERIAWSSVVGDPTTGRVYALGVCGLFLCLEGDSGKVVWSHSMSEQFGLLTTYGGRTNYPVLFDDLVVISGVMIGWGENARPNHRFMALDKSTGTPVWFNSTRPLPDDTTYSTPILGVFDGQALLVAGAGDGGLYAMQPRTGKIAWKFQMSLRGVNVSPLISGTTVFMGQSEENPAPEANIMGAVAAIDGTGKGDLTGKALWRVKEWMIGKASPILVDNRLYVFDDGGGLFVADAKNGKLVFKKKFGTMMRSSPLYADGKIYVTEATGRCYILKPTASGVQILSQVRLPGQAECHGSPIVSHGRIYIPTTNAMYCLGTMDHQPKATPRPELPKEKPVTEDTTPAQLQVVPVEVLMKPGESRQFEVRVYNANGQLLEKSPAKFTASAGGQISADGQFTADAKDVHQACTVTATAGKLTANALIRIVPSLPWKFDFNNGEIPITWVGARYRHIVREVDGEKLMVKVTTIPKGTRSQAWMGSPDLHDYTIEADLRGSIRNGKVPDMGLINQRYTIDLMGASQQLQIRTWPPEVHWRMAKTLPFPWKPDVWYRVKFRAENHGDKVVLRGKVWPRDLAEPEAWTLEVEDTMPNRHGSPGLFGNATNAEIFLDNIKVTPNS